MMFSRLLMPLGRKESLVAVVVLSGLWACSSAPQSSSDTNAAKSTYDRDNSSSNSSGSGGYEDGTGGVHGGTVAPPVVATGTVPPSANGWCAGAAKTQVVKNPKMAPLFAQFCLNGKATELFVNTLVSKAYAGTGTPNLHMISPLGSGNGMVTAFIGVGIKLPISTAKMSTAVSPQQGSVQNAIELIKQGGSTPGTVTSTPIQSNPDTGWTRGWNMHVGSTTKVTLINIPLEYEAQVDQYQVGDGLYMQTTTMTKSIETMRGYELLTASFDLNGVGYLMTVAKIAADDHGFASIAQSTVTKTANVLAMFNYKQAAAAR